MTSIRYIRNAHHAGSWYSSNLDHLHETLSGYLAEAESEQKLDQLSLPRGIIAPHAGFSYSGPTAGYAYNGLLFALKKGWRGTVLVLHPSHHVYLDGCAVSGATSIKTPLLDLGVDESLRKELLKTGQFSVMDKETDESEHSGEMQYPFIAKAIFEAHADAVSVLPIMVGAISNDQESHFGSVLGPFLARGDVFAVISSDFCHWGKRFGYTPTSPPDHIKSPDSIKQIFEYIEWMDRLGMSNIESQIPGAFVKYIKIYKNTICGRHPIAVYLWAMESNKRSGLEKVEIKFVKYAQSSQVKTGRDSSVSYASAIAQKVE